MRPSIRRLASSAASHPHPQPTTAASPYAWINPDPPTPGKGKLAGKVIALKDNISYQAAPTACSSHILDGYHPPFNATCVESLLAAGAHIVGKTKMDEFGMGSQNVHMPENYGPVLNRAGPGEPRCAGGSSGGSAVAVADGTCFAALGTDTGGSVRLPASYCGIVGLKPSYGLISRYGVVSYADSLDCVGILARNVESVEQVFGVISGPDGRDMTCVSEEVREVREIKEGSGLKGWKVGVPRKENWEISTTSTSAQAVSLPQELLDHLVSLGAQIVPVDIPSLALALPAYYVLASAEAASNLGRYGGGWYGSDSKGRLEEGELGGEVRSQVEMGEEARRRRRTKGFGKEVKKRILAGTYALTADAFNNSYLKALHIRRLVRDDFASLLGDLRIKKQSHRVDVLLHPTSTGTAPFHPFSSNPTSTRAAPSSTSEYMQDLLTVPASLAGVPAISVPSGRGEDGWPLGVSVVAGWGREEAIFTIAKEVERWNRGG